MLNVHRAANIERRKNHRYQVSAPVFFCWATLNEPLQSGEGITRDIGTTGAYIYARELPPNGALVQMDIMLPKSSDAQSGAQLIGEGVVLRVDPHDRTTPRNKESGFAVSVQFYVESSESVLTHLKRFGRIM